MTPIELTLGMIYADRFGRCYKIVDHTRDRKDWVYSACGHWFEKSTGYFIFSASLYSKQYPLAEHNRSLVREVRMTQV